METERRIRELYLNPNVSHSERMRSVPKGWGVSSTGGEVFITKPEGYVPSIAQDQKKAWGDFGETFTEVPSGFNPKTGMRNLEVGDIDDDLDDSQLLFMMENNIPSNEEDFVKNENGVWASEFGYVPEQEVKEFEKERNLLMNELRKSIYLKGLK